MSEAPHGDVIELLGVHGMPPCNILVGDVMKMRAPHVSSTGRPAVLSKLTRRPKQLRTPPSVNERSPALLRNESDIFPSRSTSYGL